jgi:hypothetical protein
MGAVVESRQFDRKQAVRFFPDAVPMGWDV